jgi:predicted dehydrogenase
MKVLFVGLGSIGTRHLNNLYSIFNANICNGEELEIYALRGSAKPLSSDVQSKIHMQFTTLPNNIYFDIAFITNPTYLHAKAIGMLKGKARAFFIEKPIFENCNYKLSELGLSELQKAYVAAPMRFTALYIALKKYLQNKKDVYCARAICSSFLPDWRKGQNYKEVYSAHKEMGGGVELDLIHEWDYICDLFGAPQKVFKICGKVSNLEINSNDVALYIACLKNMVIELHLDYFGRTYRRALEVMTEDGSITADFFACTLTLETGEVQNYAEEVNARYIKELEYFLSYAKGENAKSCNSPKKALEVLEIAIAF